MNGIYGVASPSGRPITAEELAPMRVKEFFTLDGGISRVEGHAAFATLPISITASKDREERPLVHGTTLLVAAARLTNRDELLACLALAGDLPKTDGEIIMAAYLKFGAGCVEHLQGDWAFAVWDGDRQEFILARDATGNTALYWHWSGKDLLFGSSIKCLLAHPMAPHRPDLLSIGCMLFWRSDSRIDGASAYEGIQHLQAGRMLILQGGEVSVKRWWRPEDLKPLRFANDEQYYDAFLDVYSKAVKEAVEPREGLVGASLSGGLDSGSVVALAASHFSVSGSRLLAFTHAPLYKTTLASSHRIGDESFLAAQTAAYAGHTDTVALRGENASVVRSVRESVDIFDAPVRNAPHVHWIFEMLRAVRKADCRVLLIGQGGNSTVSYDGGRSLWPELLAGHAVSAAKEIAAEMDGARAAVKRRLLYPLRHPERPKMSEKSRRTRSAISEAFIQELGLNRLKDEFGPRTLAGMPTLDAFRLGLMDLPPNGIRWTEGGAAFQVEVRDPTRDRRVVEFCWRVPGRIYWSNGLRRGLIRRGLRGRLPEEVLLCRGKGQQISDFGERSLGEKQHFLDELTQLQSHPLASRFLDLGKMRNCLLALERDTSPVNVQATREVLVRGLAVGIFLSRF